MHEGVDCEDAGVAGEDDCDCVVDVEKHARTVVEESNALGDSTR